MLDARKQSLRRDNLRIRRAIHITRILFQEAIPQPIMFEIFFDPRIQEPCNMRESVLYKGVAGDVDSGDGALGQWHIALASKPAKFFGSP